VPKFCAYVTLSVVRCRAGGQNSTPRSGCHLFCCGRERGQPGVPGSDCLCSHLGQPSVTDAVTRVPRSCPSLWHPVPSCRARPTAATCCVFGCLMWWPMIVSFR